MNSNTTNSVNIQNIPLEKVRVGDIDIAYKMFGNGEPILLNSGSGGGIDGWTPSILTSLSTNHTVIVFDSRGLGNTSIVSKPYSIQQLANDVAGLLDALKIKNADVLGYSLGSLSQLNSSAVTHPEKVNRLVLIAASKFKTNGREVSKYSKPTNKSMKLFLFRFIMPNKEFQASGNYQWS